MSNEIRHRVEGALVAFAFIIGALTCIGLALLAQQAWALQWW